MFTRIVEGIFAEYFMRLDILEQNRAAPFVQLQKLIDLQFDIVEEFPADVYIILSKPPVRFHDDDNVYVDNIKIYRRRMADLSPSRIQRPVARLPAFIAKVVTILTAGPAFYY